MERHSFRIVSGESPNFHTRKLSEVMVFFAVNITVFSKSDALGRSFIYFEKSSGPRIDYCGTPHVVFG